jgi:integrase
LAGTTQAYLLEWLETVRPQLRPRTWQRYEELIRLHALATLGRVQVAQLGPERIQLCLTEALQKGLSPTTVGHLHAVLHRALAQAERWGVIARNPAALVDPPRMVRREMQTFSPAQVRTLLATARGDRLEAVWVLAVTTGMRQGELLALHWREVDLDTGRLAVTGSLQRIRGAGLTITEPKTLRSRRQVILTPIAVSALQQHWKAQRRELEIAGDQWRDSDLVFTNVVGGPLQRDHVVKRNFDPLLVRAGLPRIRFHDLRHTAATLMLSQGVHPKVAADLLGHATVGITLDLYSHSTEAMHQEAARAIEKLLEPKDDGDSVDNCGAT